MGVTWVSAPKSDSNCLRVRHLLTGRRLGYWLVKQFLPSPFGLPGGSDSKECLQCRLGFYPWVGKIPWRRAWQPTPVFMPGESPWTEEPGGLQSTGSKGVRHDWVTKPSTELFCYWFSVGASPFSLRLIKSICCSKYKCFKFLFQLWKFKHNSMNWNPKAFCTFLKFSLKWSEIVQSCPILGNPMDCNLPGSSIHGIFQARILVWVSISFSRGSSWPRNQTLSPVLQSDALLSEPQGKLLQLLKFSLENYFPSFMIKSWIICREDRQQ